MKRDVDLIRAIALETEKLEDDHELISMDNISAHTFAAHVQLMIDAGLIEGRVQKYIGQDLPSAQVLRLTWAGCDFLDAARSETLWKKAKGTVLAPTASWTFEILGDWLRTEIKNGLPTIRGLAG